MAIVDYNSVLILYKDCHVYLRQCPYIHNYINHRSYRCTGLYIKAKGNSYHRISRCFYGFFKV